MNNLFTPTNTSEDRVNAYTAQRELSINDEHSNKWFDEHFDVPVGISAKDKFAALSPAEQMRMMGYRSKANSQVLTPEQDKAKTKRKHEEIELQAKFCTWVRSNYPNVKFLRHEREKARSKFLQNQMQVLNSAGSMPDWETTQTTERYAGLLIEFKKPGEKWLMADGQTIKPEYAYQYHCHVGLWKQRKVVYFCNDLEIAKLILQQYFEGRNMRQRVYKYPEKLAHLEFAS